MQIIREMDALRSRVAAWRAEGLRIALVPTMGGLHAGHIALVIEARRRSDRIVVSNFVNPTQFGPNEDLSRYPRREAADAALLEQEGCDVMWAPTVETMYPKGHCTTVSVAGISEGLCGADRPGHFDGVATVVAKLFGQVQPDVALFGEKDFQQLAVIRQMVADLDMPVEIVGVPIQRDADGVALSTRNAYLSPEERLIARVLPRALGESAASIARGEDIEDVLDRARARLLDAGFGSVDYFELCDAHSLKPVRALEGDLRLLAAARIGTTRLIDNLAVPLS